MQRAAALGAQEYGFRHRGAVSAGVRMAVVYATHVRWDAKQRADRAPIRRNPTCCRLFEVDRRRSAVDSGVARLTRSRLRPRDLCGAAKGSSVALLDALLSLRERRTDAGAERRTRHDLSNLDLERRCHLRFWRTIGSTSLAVSGRSRTDRASGGLAGRSPRASASRVTRFRAVRYAAPAELRRVALPGCDGR